MRERLTQRNHYSQQNTFCGAWWEHGPNRVRCILPTELACSERSRLKGYPHDETGVTKQYPLPHWSFNFVFWFAKQNFILTRPKTSLKRIKVKRRCVTTEWPRGNLWTCLDLGVFMYAIQKYRVQIVWIYPL